MSAIEAAVRIVVDLLVRGEYETIERLTDGKHLPAIELKTAVKEYGRALKTPGDGWWDSVDVTEREPGVFDIAAPLWTHEEGRSDLTLELDLIDNGDETYEIKVRDLHVL